VPGKLDDQDRAGQNMLLVRAAIALCVVLATIAAQADEPFYKGKRLTILINFAAGGPTDIEGRLFAKHLARHIDGAPSIIIQNMDGAGGIVGAKYLGEVAPRDGSIAGYFTGTAFMIYRSIKGAMPSGRLWDIYKAIIAADGVIQRVIVMPPGVPAPAVAALRAAITRVNGDKAYAQEAERSFGFVPQWEARPDTPKVAQAALSVPPDVRTFLVDYIKNVPK